MNEINFYGHTPPSVAGEPTPGRLIVIEGTDGVGRSTQIGMLQEWLEAEGYAVTVTGFRRSELAATGINRAMRGNTLDALTLNLFYATDFWDRMEKTIVPALRTGMVASGGSLHILHHRQGAGARRAGPLAQRRV